MFFKAHWRLRAAASGTRRQLAAQPVADKLRLLDQLRQRSLDIAATRDQKAIAMSAPELKANSDEMKVGITD